MSDPTLALHKALIAALDNAVSCDVWDSVPQGSAYPYVVMDSTAAVNNDFVDSRFDERFIYLSVWSESYGQAEIFSIFAEIQTLHETDLELETGEMISLRIERQQTSREPDNMTFMGRVVLRVLTTH